MAVVALQPLLSRETDPTEGGVVTVSRFNTGAQPLLEPSAPARLQRTDPSTEQLNRSLPRLP